MTREVVVGLENAVRQPVGADHAPEVLDRGRRGDLAKPRVTYATGGREPSRLAEKTSAKSLFLLVSCRLAPHKKPKRDSLTASLFAASRLLPSHPIPHRMWGETRAAVFRPRSWWSRKVARPSRVGNARWRAARCATWT
jgi:hypothetical protein